MSRGTPEIPASKLSPERVIELKHHLAENPSLVKLAAAHLAIGVVQDLHNVSLRTDFSYDLVQDVGVETINCHNALETALALRNDEWPENAIVQPEALDQVIARAFSGGLYG